MNIKDLIKDKTCYIVSNELKEEILNYINDNKLLLDIHFFSLSELIDKIYFKYDDKAVYKVAKEENISFGNAKIIINNLRYLMYSNKINNEKYIHLLNIKEYLDKENLLIYDLEFIDYLKRYKLVSDLNKGNEFLFKINELLDQKIKFITLDIKDNIDVYEFKDSEEEIAYVANEIASLLNTGITPSKIHLLNFNDAYKAYIDKIFTLFNIPYYLDNSNFLYDLNVFKRLYSNYLNGISTLEDTEYTYTFNSLLQSLSFIENNDDRNEYLLYLLKNKKVKKEKYKNCIQISSFETVYLENHYYFFIGLNNKVCPILKKDEDYLSDKVKDELGYITSLKVNELTRNYYINHLSSTSNICISYRLKDFFNSYLKSDIINEVKANIVKRDLNNDYSKNYDMLRLTKELDMYYKYDSKSNELIDILTKIKKDSYKSYNNSYKNIDNDYYQNNVIDKKISISYSSFQKFNECNYKYYLDSILKENEDSFNTYLGSLFHYVLEQIYKDDFDFDNCINEYKSEYILNDKEQVLLNILIPDFKNKIKIIKEQYNKGNYKIIKKEENISLKVKSDLLIRITGFIDKIMLDDKNHAYLVDYKTGDTKLTLDYLDYGLKCQLPFYFYLLKKSENYANKFLVGCYLQIINFKIRGYKESDKELLLEGLTYNNENIISEIDNYYQSDSFIKGIKPNKNGLGTYAKTFNDEEFEHIIDTMDTNIKKMINDVRNANFNINPKMIKKKETTCLYCNYKDICYRKFKDYVDIRKDNKDEMDK